MIPTHAENQTFHSPKDIGTSQTSGREVITDPGMKLISFNQTTASLQCTIRDGGVEDEVMRKG